MPPLRFRAVWTALSLLILASCGPGSSPDVVDGLEPPMDVVCSRCHDGALDAIDTGEGTDAADASNPMDGADGVSPDVADAPIPPDAMDAPSTMDVADGGGADASEAGLAGPCTMVGAENKIADEASTLSRLVYVRADGAGYLSGSFAQMAGLNNAYLMRVATDGTRTTPVNVTNSFGASIRGGDFAVDGTGHLDAYSSNMSGSYDVFLHTVNGSDMSTGSPIRVSNDPDSSEDPQIEATATGWVVVWRSRGAGTSVLMSATVANGTYAVGPPTTLTSGVVVGAFDLVSSGSRIALAYVVNMTGSAVANVVELSAAGTFVGSPVPLTMATGIDGGSTLIDSIGAAMRVDDLVVVSGLQPMGTLTVQRYNLTTHAMSAPRALSELGGNNSKPGIGLDGTSNFVVAYRGVAGTAATIEMARLDATLAPRENGSIASSVAATGDSVRIASRGDGTFALGWSDTATSGVHTTANVQVMRCP